MARATKPVRITAVGLGPAGPELVTSAAVALLQGTDPVWLRTVRHPAASLVPKAHTFDSIYDIADKIEDVYPRIVDALVEAATDAGHVVYAVPGSPAVAEATVELLRADPRVDLTVVPALSYLDLTWARLGIDPLTAGPRIVDGRRFAIEAAGERGPLLVAQCDRPWVLSEIKLAYEAEPPPSVTVLQRLGLPDESIITIAWEDLDRKVKPDHLTSLWIPEVVAPVAYELTRLTEIARRLRAECPWDIEQTHASLGKHIVEETYELLEAIDELTEDPVNPAQAGADELFIEELGDVLFQVFAHAAIAEQEGRFNISDVAEVVNDKLIARHPHVYGDVIAKTADDVLATWESNKKKEKNRESIMEGIPRSLPALMYANKVLRKATTAGLVITADDIADTGIGGAFLVLVDEARKVEVDSEEALREVVTRLRLRFERAEHLATKEGVDLSKSDAETTRKYWELADT